MSQIREVDIEPSPYATERVCEMVAVTGTRIAEEYCYYTSPQIEEIRAAEREEHLEILRAEQRRLNDEYLKQSTFPEPACRGCLH